MAKEKKSARELADMIAARMIIGPRLVSVYKDASYGWTVNVFTGPSKGFRVAVTLFVAARHCDSFCPTDFPDKVLSVRRNIFGISGKKTTDAKTG
jgi:hypothetical protein